MTTRSFFYKLKVDARCETRKHTESDYFELTPHTSLSLVTEETNIKLERDASGIDRSWSRVCVSSPILSFDAAN